MVLPLNCCRFLTLVERKIIASAVKSCPNVVGYLGLLHLLQMPLTSLERNCVTSSANIYLFILAPIITLF